MFWDKNDKHKPDWFGSKLNDNEIALQSGDYSAIPRIFCVFSENHALSKARAASILCHLLDRLTFDEVVRIDAQMRQTTSMEWFINWRDYAIDSFFTSSMNECKRRAVVIFASFNPNGFIRERAVRMMKDYADTLPFIILRQNDWVVQVRQAAALSFTYRLQNLSDGEIIAAIPFADKLRWSSRGSHDEYTEKFFAVLTSPAYEQDLLKGFASSNIRTRRICTNALFGVKYPNIKLAFKRLILEPDPFLRAAIFKKLNSRGQKMDSTIGIFLNDKYSLNRILAFQYLCDNDQNRALQVAQDLLLDKNAAVRENARQYISNKVLDFDFRSFYKAHMADFSVSAISGLGETGKEEDTIVIEGYLNSATTSAARAAMTAVMRLDGTKYALAITEFLADHRVGLVKTARNLIIKVNSPDYVRVMEILRSTPYENTKQKCFSILLTAGKWQRLIYILDVLENGGLQMVETSMAALKGWIIGYNSSFAVASAAQIEKL